MDKDFKNKLSKFEIELKRKIKNNKIFKNNNNI
jgi:hypothetical protein